MSAPPQFNNAGILYDCNFKYMHINLSTIIIYLPSFIQTLTICSILFTSGSIMAELAALDLESDAPSCKSSQSTALSGDAVW